MHGRHPGSKRLPQPCQWQMNPRKKLKRENIDPERSIKAFHLLQISFDFKIGDKFTEESNKDPFNIWKAIEAFNQPNTLQNQTTLLKKIFSTSFSETNVKNIQLPH
ncbi:hypothetical protein O181_088603 [Austropuccinia psidii MF-1]|uniref:Uncharacterized protein n=1 Tax=Austropuccinia psidii MF-1 TaxID=1389203 RepID=A0A9Q3IRS3_9BASI|nr:hypothetical protein [Austropuccinia psidii MF-1]